MPQSSQLCTLTARPCTYKAKVKELAPRGEQVGVQEALPVRGRRQQYSANDDSPNGEEQGTSLHGSYNEQNLAMGVRREGNE